MEKKNGGCHFFHLQKKQKWDYFDWFSIKLDNNLKNRAPMLTQILFDGSRMTFFSLSLNASCDSKNKMLVEKTAKNFPKTRSVSAALRFGNSFFLKNQKKADDTFLIRHINFFESWWSKMPVCKTHPSLTKLFFLLVVTLNEENCKNFP